MICIGVPTQIHWGSRANATTPNLGQQRAWAGLTHVLCPKLSRHAALPRSKVTPDGHSTYKAKEPKRE